MATLPNQFVGERLPDNRVVAVPFPVGISISTNDLLWWDPVNLVAKPASAMPDQGSLIANQRYFAQNFLGVAKDAWLASEIDTGTAAYRTVSLDWIGDMACQQQSWLPGALVAIDRNTAIPANYTQQVNQVSQSALAIGVYFPNRDLGITVGYVRVRLTTNIDIYTIDQAVSCPLQFPGGSSNLADANITMDPSFASILNQTPSVARTILLPPNAISMALQYRYTNLSVSQSVTFLSSTSTAIKGNGVVPGGKSATFWYDSNLASWVGMVSA